MNSHPYPTHKPSGIEWLGNVPEHWNVLAIRHGYEIQLGKMLQPTPRASEDKETPYLKAVHVQWFSVQTADPPTMWANSNDVSQFGIQEGDLLICEGGEGGRSGIVEADVDGYIIQNALHRIRPKGLGFNQYLRFVMYAAAAYGWLDALNDKATIAHFTREKLAAFRIPLPPLPEQRAIAAFLDRETAKIDALVAKKERLIELLEEGRNNFTQKAIQSPGATTHRLGVVADLMERPIKRANEEMYTPIGLYNRGRGIFLKEPERGKHLGDSSFFWVEDGDLVISGQFAWEGAIALASDIEHRCVASHRFPILRGKPHILETGFLFAFLQSGWGQLLLDLNSRGAAGRNRPLNTRALMKEKISLPPLEVQRQIVDMLVHESRVRQKVAKWSKLLQEYRTRLIADVVTGRIDIRKEAGCS